MNSKNAGIVDISVLAGLTKPRGVYLTDNQITDVSPLAILSNLMELELGNNPIEDFSSLKEIAAKLEHKDFEIE
ncbi:MAG: leucine-rich repeat domain-containing protein [Chloroflexi bacterium]|nr:leucine-rich repeat domain-containing protein [Chloroflexota bacterium]